MDDARRAMVFGQVAQLYSRWRPGYPDEAVDWLVAGAGVVVDLGAGTGQLTGAVLARGARVHAVEPDRLMLTELRDRFPHAVGHLAPSHQVPLADDSVDAVVSGDAWQWFRELETIEEVRRVLRPGGWLGLVWNMPEPSEPWEFELAALDPDRGQSGSSGESDGTDDSDMFGPFPAHETTVREFRWIWNVTPEQIRGHLATHSSFLTLPELDRLALLDAAESVVAQVTRRRGTPTASMHRLSYCVRWTPSAG